MDDSVTKLHIFTSLIDLAWFQGRIINKQIRNCMFSVGGSLWGDTPGDPPADPLGDPPGDPPGDRLGNPPGAIMLLYPAGQQSGL